MKTKTILGAIRCPHCGGAILEVMRDGKTECPHCQKSFVGIKIVDVVD